MTGSPQISQTTAALTERDAVDARRPMNRRATDLIGYAAALAEGLRYAEQERDR